MSISTYAELKTAVEAWTHREDLTALVPDFITLAEEQMARDLKGCAALTTIQAGLSLTAGNDTLTLAAGAQGLQQLRMLTPSVRVLPQWTADAVRACATASGTPSKAAVIGGSVSGGLSVRVHPTPDQACTFDAQYASLPALSVSNPTNFVLVNAPSIYLYGALLQAAPYMVDDPRINTWQALYGRAVSSFMEQEWSGPVMLRTDLPMSRHARYDITQG